MSPGGGRRIPCPEAVAAVAASEGVDIVFGVPDASLRPLYAALRHGGAITIITMRHPDDATHAADGRARAGGKVGMSIGPAADPAGQRRVPRERPRARHRHRHRHLPDLGRAAAAAEHT